MTAIAVAAVLCCAGWLLANARAERAARELSRAQIEIEFLKAERDVARRQASDSNRQLRAYEARDFAGAGMWATSELN